MAQRSSEVTVDQVCQEVCRLTWGSIGPPGQEAIRARVRGVLEEAAAGEFATWLTVRRQSQSRGTVVIRHNPFAAEPRKQTATLQRIARRSRELIERLEQGQARLF